MDVRSIIGEKIKKSRLENELTIESLASKSGVAFSTVSLIERGKNNPSIEVLEKICSVLGISVFSLFDIDENSAKKPPQKKIPQAFRFTDQINALPLKERKRINNIVSEALALIDVVADKGDQNVQNRNMR